MCEAQKGWGMLGMVLEGMHRVFSTTSLDNLGYYHAAAAWRGSKYILNPSTILLHCVRWKYSLGPGRPA
jgi:hypothetical protein